MVLPGQKVRDKFTGYTGICDHRSEYMSSAPRIGIQPTTLKPDGSILDTCMFDEAQVEILDAKRIIEIDAPPPKYAFGQKIKDPVTGYVGIITGRAVYANGCARVGVEQELVKGEVQPICWINEERVEPVGKVKVEKQEPVRTGGPAASALRRDTSVR